MLGALLLNLDAGPVAVAGGAPLEEFWPHLQWRVRNLKKKKRYADEEEPQDDLEEALAQVADDPDREAKLQEAAKVIAGLEMKASQLRAAHTEIIAQMLRHMAAERDDENALLMLL